MIINNYFLKLINKSFKVTFFIITSLFNFINREIIILTFQLQEFFINNYIYINFFNEKNRQFVNYIVKNNFRSLFIFREIKNSIRDERLRARFNFIELSF